MHTKLVVSLWGLLLLGFVVGCTESETSGSGSAITTTDSSAKQLVQNPAEGPAVFRVSEIRRLGIRDGVAGDPTLFVMIADLAVSQSGRIYVADNGTRTVRVFNSDGTFLGTVGAPGAGPGEFTRIGRIELAGDTLLVLDGAADKTEIFGPDRRHLMTWVHARGNGLHTVPFAVANGGWIGFVQRPRSSAARSAPYTNTMEVNQIFPRSDSVGAHIASLPVTSASEGEAVPLFHALPEIGSDQEGKVYVSAADDYRVDVFDTRGTLLLRIHKQFEPRTITRADVDEYRDLILLRVDTASRLFNPRDVERQRAAEEVQRRASLPLPAIAKPSGVLLVSPEGSFWLERVERPNPAALEFERQYGDLGRRIAEEPTRWDLFSPEGRILGSVSLPGRFTPMAVSGTQVTGVFLDELDVQYVVTLRAES